MKGKITFEYHDLPKELTREEEETLEDDALYCMADLIHQGFKSGQIHSHLKDRKLDVSGWWDFEVE